MYKHQALVQLFDAFKATETADCIKQVRKVGYMLANDGLQVMRYNTLVLSVLSGMYWTGGVPGVGSQIGFWVRLWWDGIPGWRQGGPPMRPAEASQEEE
jgi:hypothetical protein